jgi:hypothetical protein
MIYFNTTHRVAITIFFIIITISLMTMFFAASFALLNLGLSTSNRYGAALFASIGLQIARITLTWNGN